MIGPDWAKVAKTCAGAERDWVETCFGSFGQNVSVATFRKPTAIVPLCAIARRYGGETECFRYAAMDFAGTYSGGKQAAVLCTLAPPAVRGSCYEAIGRMVRYLRNSTAARRAECRAIAPQERYAARCIAGTTTTSAIPGLARAPTQ